PMADHVVICPQHSHLYTLSLHDALPIYTTNGTTTGSNRSDFVVCRARRRGPPRVCNEETTVGIGAGCGRHRAGGVPYRHYHASGDRKSTRLNSSHVKISYAVFCLKKKKQ